MSGLVLRNEKGSRLTLDELDGNFDYLQKLTYIDGESIDGQLIRIKDSTIYVADAATYPFTTTAATFAAEVTAGNWKRISGDVNIAVPYNGTVTPASTPTGTGAAYWNATQAGTYTNFGGVVVAANSMAIISRNASGVFSISQTALDLTSYAEINNEAIVKSDLAFTLVPNSIEGTNQNNTDETSTAASVSSIYGYSFAIGNKLPFNKIFCKIRQVPTNSIGQIEVRFLQENASGALIKKQRFILTPDAVNITITPELVLDSVVSYSGKIWMQILTDKPFSPYKKTATTYTSANGYNPATCTLVNNLDGTAFATAQGYFDVYVNFNSLSDSIAIKEPLSIAVDSKIDTQSNKVSSLKNYDYSLQVQSGYIDLSGDYVGSLNWRSTDFIPVVLGDVLKYKGKTNSIVNALTLYDASFSKISSPITNSTSDAVEQTHTVVNTLVKYARFSGTIISAIKSFKVSGKFNFGYRVDNTNLKIEYSNIIKTSIKTWNVIGHSIWKQDGELFTTGIDNGLIAIGIQTLVRRKIFFTSYNNYSYSGYSLGGNTLGDTTSILNQSGTWVAGDVWTYDSITNDFKKNIPIGTTSDFTGNTGKLTYYGALRELHEAIKALNPSYQMICANALHRDNASYTSFSTNTVGATITDYENALLWVRNYLSWQFVDQRKDSGIGYDSLSLYTYDGLHPVNIGYAKYANLWIDKLIKIS